MKKIVRYGYVGKRYDHVTYEELETIGIYKTRGKQWQWDSNDWPSCKVKITIEEIKGDHP